VFSASTKIVLISATLISSLKLLLTEQSSICRYSLYGFYNFTDDSLLVLILLYGISTVWMWIMLPTFRKFMLPSQYLRADSTSPQVSYCIFRHKLEQFCPINKRTLACVTPPPPTPDTRHIILHNLKNDKQTNSMAWARERTIPTERPPL
jgi:hypothetical protein